MAMHIQSTPPPSRPPSTPLGTTTRKTWNPDGTPDEYTSGADLLAHVSIPKQGLGACQVTDTAEEGSVGKAAGETVLGAGTGLAVGAGLGVAASFLLAAPIVLLGLNRYPILQTFALSGAILGAVMGAWDGAMTDHEQSRVHGRIVTQDQRDGSKTALFYPDGETDPIHVGVVPSEAP